jgi:hypothetical protein
VNGGDNPFRAAGFPAGVFAYGCPPTFDPPNIPDFVPPISPVIPNPDLRKTNLDWAKLLEGMRNGSFAPCPKCNNHIRTAEPCPFCLRDDLNALKKALGPEAKPAETIETLRAALRKTLGALRDISRVTGGSLEPLIAECEKALDA